MLDQNQGTDPFAGSQEDAAQGASVNVVTPDAQALADAQAKLAADQAAHDAAATQLATDQAALDAAVTQLSADQRALSDAQAAHDAAVAAAAQAAQDAATAAAATAAAQTPPASTGGVAPTGDVAPTTQLDAAHSMVDDIEAIAVKWGGDIGTDLRNLAGKLRSLFGTQPATSATATTTETPAAQ